MIKFFSEMNIAYYNDIINKEIKSDKDIMELQSVYISNNPSLFTLKITNNMDNKAYYSLSRIISNKVSDNTKNFMPYIKVGKCTFNYYINDELRENDKLIDIVEYTQYFLNDNCMENLFVYMKYSGIGNNFLYKLDEIKDKFDVSNMIVVSGAVINAYGFRQSTDIDAKIIVKSSSNVRSLDNKGLKYFSPKTFYKENRQSELINTVPVDNFEDIMYNSLCFFYLKGIKFLSLKIETEMKALRITPKGYADVYYYRYIFGTDLPKVIKLPNFGKIYGKVGPYNVEWKNKIVFIEQIKKKLHEYYKLKISTNEITNFISGKCYPY